MSLDRGKLNEDAKSCLGQDKPVGELVDCVKAHFPGLEAYREGDDLVIKQAGRFLMVRRVGTERFRVSENVWAPSTNMIDYGGGTERSLDQLIDEISALTE